MYATIFSIFTLEKLCCFMLLQDAKCMLIPFRASYSDFVSKANELHSKHFHNRTGSCTIEKVTKIR
jgi:hypothetical protein